MSTPLAGAPTHTISFTDFVDDFMDATTLRAELGEAGRLRKHDA